MAAPEMSPTLDDVLRALDGASVNGVIRRDQLATVRAFLEQLNDLRDCPAVVLDQEQAALMEGAYQAGVRCADESGHVLVVSLPAFLALQGHGAPSSRLSWRARLEEAIPRPLRAVAVWAAFCSFVAALADRDATAAVGFMLAAGVAVALDRVLRLPHVAAVRAPDPEPAPDLLTTLNGSRCSWPECLCSFERMVCGCQSHKK